MLARSGIAGPRAGASVVVDFTAGLVAQVVFILLGIVLYFEQRGGAGGCSTSAAVLRSSVGC
ncbi:MAG TPA: hypothetical protein VE592_09815 [Geminicoccaceae bacterium]|nr:hypothetical protein [Geminicoccaceae bacterium]